MIVVRCFLFYRFLTERKREREREREKERERKREREKNVEKLLSEKTRVVFYRI